MLAVLIVAAETHPADSIRIDAPIGGYRAPSGAGELTLVKPFVYP